jgi:hypothetical protein
MISETKVLSATKFFFSLCFCVLGLSLLSSSGLVRPVFDAARRVGSLPEPIIGKSTSLPLHLLNRSKTRVIVFSNCSSCSEINPRSVMDSNNDSGGLIVVPDVQTSELVKKYPAARGYVLVGDAKREFLPQAVYEQVPLELTLDGQGVIRASGEVKVNRVKR